MQVPDIEADLTKFNEYMLMYGTSSYGKLRKRTRQKHTTLIRSYLKASDGKVTKSTVEAFLRPYVDQPHKWNNRLKGLRVYCRDYLKLESAIKGLELQEVPDKAKTAPKPAQLLTFYGAIPESEIILRAIFLLLASSGLRLNEILTLKFKDINSELRLITPNVHLGRTKRSYYSFYNSEAEEVFSKVLKLNPLLIQESSKAMMIEE